MDEGESKIYKWKLMHGQISQFTQEVFKHNVTFINWEIWMSDERERLKFCFDDWRKFEKLGSKSWATGEVRKHASNGCRETITATVF